MKPLSHVLHLTYTDKTSCTVPFNEFTELDPNILGLQLRGVNAASISVIDRGTETVSHSDALTLLRSHGYRVASSPDPFQYDWTENLPLLGNRVVQFKGGKYYPAQHILRTRLCYEERVPEEKFIPRVKSNLGKRSISDLIRCAEDSGANILLVSSSKHEENVVYGVTLTSQRLLSLFDHQTLRYIKGRYLK